MEKEIEKVELIGENGEKEEFLLDASFESNNKQYVILSKDDAEDALMMRVDYDEDKNPLFVQIEDDLEFESALKDYEELVSE